MAVLEAADDLLAERGFAGVTIEGIADRAQVAKQTIYRWWASKTDILFDALAEDAAAYFTAYDGDDLGSDLRRQLRQLAAFLTDTDAGAVCRALAGQAQHDPGVAARFHAEFVTPQRSRDGGPFRRAQGRGELPDVMDIDFAVDQLVGPIYYRVLITGQPVPPEFTDALVDQYLSRAARLKALAACCRGPETPSGARFRAKGTFPPFSPEVGSARHDRRVAFGRLLPAKRHTGKGHVPAGPLRGRSAASLVGDLPKHQWAICRLLHELSAASVRQRTGNQRPRTEWFKSYG
jgi:AcrR family transcriptional regulator